MPIFEIQIVSDGRWKAKDLFDDHEAAYECAERIDRTHQPEQLRIRRIDMTKSGMLRERTVYDGGRKVRREQAAAKKNQEQDAFLQRVADRRIQRTMAEDAAAKIKLFSSTSPVYLTLVSLSIFLTGLSAMYLVERAFMSY
jgi:hypothetical protein